MKKQILKTIVTVGLLCSSNLLADTLAPTPQEYQEIVDSFKLMDTTYKDLSKTYKIDGDIVEGKLERQDDTKDSQYAQHIIILNNKKLYEPNSWHGIYIYDQKLLSVACIASNKEKVVTSVARSSYYYKQKKQKLINYAVFVASFTKDTTLGNYEISGLFNEKHSAGWETSIPTYNPKEFFLYFNEPRILARLYETGICDKELTQKANIEVLIEDKWIPQEQSWNIKDEISNNANSSIQNPSLTQNQLLENVKSNQKVFIENINEVLKAQELTTKTLQKYNDIAYYLQQANANEEAIFLLEKIIEKFPNRTVAYLNLADAYNGINNKEKAKVNYEKYISLMKQDNRELKIPKRVLEYK
jgi:tetratricopeptide (TPR) repeat protein